MVNMFEPSMYDLEEYDEEEYDYQQDYSTRITLDQLHELYKYCMHPTLRDAYTNLLILFASCGIFKVVTSSIGQPDTAHQLSAAIGTYMLFIHFKWEFLHTVGLIIAGYVIILVLSNNGSKRRGFFCCCTIATYLVSCEMFLVNTDTWQRVRGPQMIAAMKIISLAFDLDWRVVRTVDIFEYIGYLLDLGTCVWGPWMSYNDYKNKQEHINVGWAWIKDGLLCIIKSLIFFTMSVCFLEFLVPTFWGGWWVVYRDAMSFRMSHYFVSSVSEATLALSGYEKRDVSRPFDVELPRSLVGVVVNWNLPTHKWLKIYIFKPSLGYYGTFMAIMFTYFLSSLLHGLNPSLAAVLLSLGFYTYTEHSLRLKLSSRFSACVSSKSCPSRCPHHRHTSSNLIVHSINLIFSLLTMFHLAYLGILMNFNNDPLLQGKSFAPWENLHFVSHWVMLLTFFLNICL